MASTASIAALSSFSSLSLGRSLPLKPRVLQSSTLVPLFGSSKLFSLSHPIRAGNDKDIDTSFFDNFDPNADVPFDPPTPPEGYVPPPSFDELPPETEEDITTAYEEIYGPAYSGVSVLGNDVYVMDAHLKKSSGGFLGRRKKEKPNDGFEERVVQVRRVTKVVKGGKKLSFRAIVVVGDKNGQVGIGVGKAKEVVDAIAKSATNARRNIVTVPMTKYSTFPHRSDGDYGAAKVMLRPASPGTGVIAGGAVRIVLEMAGVANALGKQLRSKNALNNARATVVAIQKMRQFRDVARERGIPMEELWK
ncbi:LOW QUALITY PROTEIN: 30S ribosomal protein S5, chloroplastic [Dioscorea cayenensis subsp. rotundata]|uniref:Small ribosomal subunit protein uS5c n=1 Tax=Dioscorea cayennensis subsp. rotundata TaxID=55577 RepID=A0AB40CH10_DIOCR|nr:LOW QUALITY PROTEIN: 30S ribosomal protein S5, chloroplastic [Dioscorea cayenensis subsp. rotundata]